MSAISQGVFAVAHTRRRRLLWCAWWSGEPTAVPFREPDAWGGGARDEDEARALAERAAGQTLRQIEARWAGAWVRVRAGKSPFVEPGARPLRVAAAPRDPHALLGVAPGADLAALKAAFRERALATHPDRGGDAAAFVAIKRAFDVLAARARRR